MSSYSIIAEITAFQPFRQDGSQGRSNWLQLWLDARRAKAAHRRLAAQLRYMDRRLLADAGIDPAGLSSTTIRLAQINPHVVSFSLAISRPRG